MEEFVYLVGTAMIVCGTSLTYGAIKDKYFPDFNEINELKNYFSKS